MVATTVKLGILPSPQHTTWSALRDIGIRVDATGFSALWVSDHMYPGHGALDGPAFEGFLTLAAWAVQTRRSTLGLMVGANTFRNPALTAKMVTTLDHISEGRAVLGIGAGWFEPEHRAFGFDFGASVGERLDRLEEALGIMRGMLDGSSPSGGRTYLVRKVRNDPLPLQTHLPILIGGGGERKTLRLVAQYADIWNVSGEPDDVRRKDAVLRTWCERVGRDQGLIERSYHAGPVFIRDRVADARRLARGTFRIHGEEPSGDLMGPPARIVERLEPFVQAGFRSLYFDLIAPFDRETLDRIAGEVWPLLEQLV